MSNALQAGKYFLHRYVLRSETLEAQIPEHDLHLRVMPEDVVGRHLYKYARHEPENTGFLRRNLTFEPGDVVLDVGANLGWFSLICARIAGDVPIDIYSFEPEPTNFALLEHNVRANGTTCVHPTRTAVGESVGSQRLFLFKKSNRGRHSLLPSDDAESIDTPTTTLDVFWGQQELGNRTPRFIKMDIEGYELFALRGARATLARCPLVMLEYSPRHMLDAGIEPADMLDLLAASGLQPSVLESGELRPVNRESLLGAGPQVDLFFHRVAAS